MAGERGITRSGQMSAWINKKKSGSSMVRVRQYNKRYFTIDFDLRVFFYAHSTNTKKVNAFVPFADIVEVSKPEVNLDLADTTSQASKQSRVSFLRRMGSGKFGKGDDEKENKEQLSLTVVVGPGNKPMELTCSSVAEALEWFEAFTAAKEMGGGDASAAQRGLEASTSVAASEVSQGDNSESSDGNGHTRTGGSRPTSGYPANEDGTGSRPPPMPVRPAAAPVGGVADSAPTGAAPVERAALVPAPAEAAAPASAPVAGPSEPEEAADVAPPKPPVRGTLWDLTTETEAGAAATEVGRPAGGAPEEAEAVQAVTNLASPGSGEMQATDFGFDGVEASDSESETEDAKPAGGAALADPAGDARGSAISTGANARGPAEGSTAGGAAVSYADRSEGLSLQQRLANLEFSDDEDDDDDDPLGLKSKAR